MDEDKKPIAGVNPAHFFLGCLIVLIAGATLFLFTFAGFRWVASWEL